MKRLITIITAITLALSISSVARAEALGVLASKQSILVGEQTAVTVFVLSPHQAMNAVSGTLSFPANVKISNISTSGSIVDFWTQEPHIVGNTVQFEGIVLNPGYQGNNGKLFTILATGKKAGTANFTFSDGALLANDGLGSNIVTVLETTAVRIGAAEAPSEVAVEPQPTIPPARPIALPVITDYSAQVGPEAAAFIRGKGEPGALTKIVFKDTSLKSVGEQFIEFLQTKKKKLDEVLVKNNESGEFEYVSPHKLVAGAYNATPFLVDAETQAERPGLGVQLFVSDSEAVRFLVVLINVLALLIPIVGLVVLIYFIPWYSFRRMRLIRKRFGLEEDKLLLSSHAIAREDRVQEQAIQRPQGEGQQQ